MDISRRTFLKAGTFVGLSAWATSSGVTAIAAGQKVGKRQLDVTPGYRIPERQFDTVAYLTESMFSEQLGTGFRIHSGPLSSVDVELVEVTTLTSRSGDGLTKSATRECFSILFRGPHERPLIQNTYTIEHGVLGVFALLVVPVGKDADGVYYEAVFNRLAH